MTVFMHIYWKPTWCLRFTACRKCHRLLLALRFPSAPFVLRPLICPSEVPITSRACSFFRNTKNHPLLQSKLSLNTILSVFERNEGTCGYKTLFNTKKSKFCKPHRKRMSIGSVRAFSPQRLAEILINHILTVSLVCCWPIGWFVFELSGRV